MSTDKSIVFLNGVSMSDSQSLSIFTDQGLSAEQATFCDLIADCFTTKAALERMQWTRGMYRYMRAQQPAFAAAIERAHDIAQDEWVDQLNELVDNEKDPVRMREKSSNIKWIASKRSRRYADKVDITIEQRPSILQALANADERLESRLRRDPVPVIDGEFEALPSVAATSSVDNESVALAPTPPPPDIFS